jgi:hypothetical protein
MLHPIKNIKNKKPFLREKGRKKPLSGIPRHGAYSPNGAEEGEG